MSGVSADQQVGLADASTSVIELGPWRVIFDPKLGGIRDIRFGGHEILRAIYGAVRIEHWQTVEPRCHDVTLVRSASEARLKFTASCRQANAHFDWRGAVTLTTRGELTLNFDGCARTSFDRNRIGLCVLHSGDCAGTRCIVEHTDGSIEEATFPQAIAPHQPFKGIAKLTHTPAPGLQAQVSFEGDIFEMEDQRNWTDASFKTYCTPLNLPRPVRINSGDRVRQQVALRVETAPHVSLTAYDDTACSVAVGDWSGLRLPRLGLQFTARHEPTPRQIEALRRLSLHHLRIDLPCEDPQVHARLRRAALQARQLGVTLEAVVHVEKDVEGELQRLAQRAGESAAVVTAWFIVPPGADVTTVAIAQAARKHLQPLCPGASIGGGTDGCFVDINRHHPPVHLLDALCYSINPQVHSTLDAIVMQNLQGQAPTVHSARRFVRDKPLHVSPVTLWPRFNAHTGRPTPIEREEAPQDLDPRHATGFGAVWTLGSIAALAAAGVDSLTYGRTICQMGVIPADEQQPPHPVRVQMPSGQPTVQLDPWQIRRLSF